MLKESIQTGHLGWFWLINAFQPAVWTIGAFDAAIHMQEESIPKERIPGRPVILDPAASPASFGIISTSIIAWCFGLVNAR